MSSAEDTYQTWLSHVLRWPTMPARDWALSVFPELCAKPNVLAVVLLGSTIRPADSSFDFDCLFIYAGDRPSFTRPPSDVDIRGFDVEQVDALISNRHDLLLWSIRLGRVVCERDGYWSALTRKWEGRLPFPSADVADTRADKAERLLGSLRAVGDEDATVEQLVTALTHRARAALLRASVFPASRPELPEQLREIGEDRLADELYAAIRARNALAHQFAPNSSQKHDAA